MSESMSEAARKAADLALGAADYALEAARKLTGQLAGRGGQRRREVVRRLERLAERGRRLRLATRADVEQLGTRLATRADIERLEARIAALEKALGKES
jgi:BMFP domain-containing protein YqiC